MAVICYGFGGDLMDAHGEATALRQEGGGKGCYDIGEPDDPDRPNLAKAIAELSSGDTLIVMKLDRLGPTSDAAMSVLETVGKKGATLSALADEIEISPIDYRLAVHVVRTLAAIDDAVASRMVNDEANKAKRRRSNAGRPRSLTPDQINHARHSIDSGQQSVSSMARLLKVNKTTLWRALQPEGKA